MNTEYTLMALEVGPVYDLVVTSRRTRDLWRASSIVSLVSKAAAKAVAVHSGIGIDALIFPTPRSIEDLNASSDLKVSDEILARLPVTTMPAIVAREAKESVNREWRRIAEEAKKDFGGLNFVKRMEELFGTELIDSVRWNEQLDGVMECYAAWRSVARHDDYSACHSRVKELLTARTSCRDFNPAPTLHGMAKGAGEPKSSLDGFRETVFSFSGKTKSLKVERERIPGMRKGEELDVLGIAKRFGGNAQYPSVSRIAADPWFRGAASAAPTDLLALRKEVGRLRSLERELSNGRQRGRLLADLSGFKQFTEFPYDGSIIFANRHRELCDESGLELREFSTVREIVSRISSASLGTSEPDPYFAILVADGDRVGKLLSKIEEPESHQSFSKELSKFADRVESVFIRHQGVLIYAGGDDVLGFLPVDRVLPCARGIHDEFADLLSRFAFGETKATLSVGVVIGHFLDSLEELLELTREAGHEAKSPGGADPGDGLAITYKPRGGAAIKLRRKWDAPRRIDDELADWIDLLEIDELSVRLPYDVRTLSDVYSEDWESEENLQEALRSDVRRLIRGKIGSREREPAGFAKVNRLLESVHRASDLKDLANEIILARRIAIATRIGRGNKTRSDDLQGVDR